MQWSQIKTLFIFTFLILNIYLSIQFMNKQKLADLGVLEHRQSTFEELLESENITIPESLHEESKERFISVRQRNFTDEELQGIEALEDQKTVLVNKNLIVSQFEKKPSVPDNFGEDNEAIKEVLQKLIAFPEDFTFWNWNKELNILIFFQKENDRPVYFNQNGILLVFLNDNNEAVFYTQTMLDESGEQQEPRKLIKSVEAIEKLYNSSELSFGEEVTFVDIGFHTRVPLTNGVQVFVPVWKITVNDERNYFVNAIEGHIFSSNELDFLEESIELNIERIQEMKDEKEMRSDILKFLNVKLEAINRGGTE